MEYKKLVDWLLECTNNSWAGGKYDGYKLSVRIYEIAPLYRIEWGKRINLDLLANDVVIMSIDSMGFEEENEVYDRELATERCYKELLYTLAQEGLLRGLRELGTLELIKIE